MAAWCGECGVAVWAYCLMPNHVHLIAVPDAEDALRRGIGEAHRRYTRRVNFREGWRGHLWQGRFASFVMDDAYLLACARYVERNPVRAGLVAAAEDYPWSSARSHCGLAPDGPLSHSRPFPGRIVDWRAWLAGEGDDDRASEEAIRASIATGRPTGDAEFVADLEQRLGTMAEYLCFSSSKTLRK